MLLFLEMYFIFLVFDVHYFPSDAIAAILGARLLLIMRVAILPFHLSQLRLMIVQTVLLLVLLLLKQMKFILMRI